MLDTIVACSAAFAAMIAALWAVAKAEARLRLTPVEKQLKRLAAQDPELYDEVVTRTEAVVDSRLALQLAEGMTPWISKRSNRPTSWLAAPFLMTASAVVWCGWALMSGLRRSEAIFASRDAMPIVYADWDTRRARRQLDGDERLMSRFAAMSDADLAADLARSKKWYDDNPYWDAERTARSLKDDDARLHSTRLISRYKLGRISRETAEAEIEKLKAQGLWDDWECWYLQAPGTYVHGKRFSL